MTGFLQDSNKEHCFGCEACASVCPQQAIIMKEDAEGFRYPQINLDICNQCGLCRRVCPWNDNIVYHAQPALVWGGYIKDREKREFSTSGGAFSALAEWAIEQGAIVYGAVADGLEVRHAGTWNDIRPFRKSKYIQSHIGSTFSEVRTHLHAGEKVLFSGTPCQIAGLKAYLQACDTSNLLTVEVVCEGVPSPLYIRKFVNHLIDASRGDSRQRCVRCKDGQRWDYQVMKADIDYRCKDGQRWDYQVMKADIDYRCKDGQRWDYEVMDTKVASIHWKRDRWFNPFWSIWLQHLMSRPSCYICPFAKAERVADITLGDLWGVHIYCPELYGNNGGASVVFCNSEKGIKIWQDILDRDVMYGHELAFADALRYQGPLRNHIPRNPQREEFMSDINHMEYDDLIDKWAKKSSLKLLISKYLWGTNKQKVAEKLLFRNLRQILMKLFPFWIKVSD